jgi:hypothetical protein
VCINFVPVQIHLCYLHVGGECLAKHVGEIITCNFMHFMCLCWYEGSSKSKVLYFIPAERVSALSWQVCVQFVHLFITRQH